MVQVIKEEEGQKEKKRRSRWSEGLSLALLVLSAALVIGWSTAGPKIGSFTWSDDGDNPCSRSKDKREYSGTVEDCCCDYDTVDRLDDDVLHPLLQDLVNSSNISRSSCGAIYPDRALQYPDCVRSVYFTFLFVLRPVMKISWSMQITDTENSDEDLKAHSLMKRLLYDPKLQAACPIPFNEAKLWKGQGVPEPKLKIQKQFRTISAIMDCVGCGSVDCGGNFKILVLELH